MGTLYQSIRKKKPKQRKNSPLKGNPQKKAIVLRAYTTNPRKPNSAKRKVARVSISLIDNKKKKRKTLTVCIPGKGHTIQKFSKLLIRGGNARDIPSVRCKAIRGHLDLSP